MAAAWIAATLLAAAPVLAAPAAPRSGAASGFGVALASSAALPSPSLRCVGRAPAPEVAGAPYYAIDLVPTGRVPGTRQARGSAAVTFAASPFGLAMTAHGRYQVDLRIRFDGLQDRGGNYVVWVTTADLTEVRLAGALDDEMALDTTVSWNKFLVVVTLETDLDALRETWSGPIVFRGMSRSGRMHTMAGHGPFQGEPCAKFGY